MGNKTLIYKQKVEHNLDESLKHLSKLKSAFVELEKKFNFPVDKKTYNEISHDYDNSDNHAINIINTIYSLQGELEKILNNIKKIIV
ncbi:hypothetical protein [Arcobacter roscoffensis]|uniref:Uncharacterized protein n=1 Tax=Arcobacter roscoffensis TaxID=2961520 RepID=A0ABY5E878_9BACT|nr:hypothetical protein [Arcobacter roscoffensis]UTJ07348.1 hypothetical protein NJU99_04460 [Arcobacter roscoffensis]